MADRDNAEQEPANADEEVPVEPDQEDQPDEEQDQATRRNQWPVVQHQVERDDHEEIAVMHRKVNRILDRTEDIQPIKVRLSGTYGLLHVVDQRTMDMEDVMDRTINGLEQIYDQNKELLQELRTQTTLLQGLYTSRPTHHPRLHHLVTIAPIQESNNSAALFVPVIIMRVTE